MPSSALIGALRVEATLDAGKFIDGARKIAFESKKSEQAVTSSFGGMSKAVKAGIAGFAGTLTVGLFAEGIKQALDFAKNIGVVSQQLGITTKDLQEMRYAANQVGITNDQVEIGFRFLERSISRALSGAKPTIDAFKAVGVSLDDLKTKSRTDIFKEISDGMVKQGGAARNAAAGTVLLGRAASGLNPLLDMGSKGMNNLAAAAQQLGIVLSDKQIQDSDKTATKLESLKAVLTAEIASTVSANAGSIYTLANAIGQLSNAVVHFLSTNPQLALAIIGALAGSSIGARFGIVGAAAGVVLGAGGGAFLGGKLGENFREQSTDLTLRRQELIKARDNLRNIQAQPDIGGRVMPGLGIEVSGGAEATRKARNALQHQVDLYYQAIRANQAQPTPKLPPLDQFLAPRGRAAPKGPASQDENIAFQFAQQERQANLEILRAKQQLAGSAEDRAKLDLQIIQIEHDSADAEIKHKVAVAQKDFAEGKITSATLEEAVKEAAILSAKNDELTAVKLKAFAEEQAAKKTQAIFEASQQQLQWQQDALHTADQLATTQKDHRRIQLEILDSEIEQRRLNLENEKLLAEKNGATKEQLDAIQAKIDHLPIERQQQASIIQQNTMSPLEQWAKDIPKTSQEIIEAMNKIEVQGIDGLAEALTNVVMGTESLKDAFHQLAASILSDLLQMTIKMLIFKALSSAFGIGGGGGMFGNPVSVAGAGDFSGSFGAVSGTPGFATGGSFTIAGNPGMDRNMLSLNGLPIARVSHGERVNIGNDNSPMGNGVGYGVELHIHNDFRGADAQAVAGISAKVDRMQKDLPASVVATMSDARKRFIWRQ